MYYPFGWEMPGLKKEGDYRYGFNGMEKDDEFTNSTSHLDFGARIYDSRIGRWMSVDPLYKDFPSESNYIVSGDSPIIMIDVGGEFKILVTNYAQARGVDRNTITTFANIVANVKKIMDANVLHNRSTS